MKMVSATSLIHLQADLLSAVLLIVGIILYCIVATKTD